ncbi:MULTISPECIES: DksA/TraR family C4-type zinc finger protein [Halomonas]|uniref:DksA/TraR family C4-type zinc finger protein n=2 Tax=Halomonas TaxID=2745 RepID=A0A7X4VZ30_9GAMM|nr:MULTISPECIES: DksA/TraR family C4-type zinc finger protein [Halomonas]MDR5901633.1 DksA/TraR family C4-type zinc finger protein [Halomonas icarae]NAW12982.1 DksA/TraR family C4-type zinc finger protein [Halomonas icarae]TDB04998.1 DksA/TraR family C4-type zinc finger protein [Halomonas marinisediminis]
MAGGWTRDGAVQDQIDATVEEAVERARTSLHKGDSAEFCVECDAPIPEGRRKALPGVQLCVACQSSLEAKGVDVAAINRRASKDSQLR